MTAVGFLQVVFLTILTYRISTYMVILFWGKTRWWRSISTDKWNHYQLGILLVLLSLLSPKIPNITTYPSWLPAIGTGMIIDEVSDILKLVRPKLLPKNFRDSFPDLLLIIFSYSVFAILVLAVT